MFIYYFILESIANGRKGFEELKQIGSYIKRKMSDVEGDMRDTRKDIESIKEKSKDIRKDTRGTRDDVKYLIKKTKDIRRDIGVNAGNMLLNALKCYGYSFYCF